MAEESLWKYDAARDCYVEQKTGFTSTLEALVTARSNATFQVGPPGYGADRAHQARAQMAQKFQIQKYQSQSARTPVAPTPESDIAWLRRRVDEILWRLKAA